jgi:Transposase
LGRLVDVDTSLDEFIPSLSLMPGPDLEGSWIVALSTPVRFSVSLDRGPPGDPPEWNIDGIVWRAGEVAARRKQKRKPIRTPVPVEIADAEHELVIERAAAIDVAKASGKVCVRLPGQSGHRVSRVWDVSATTGAVADLAGQLVDLGVGRVSVESTSDYWRIWYYLLEAAGLRVDLVNAKDVKNVPGRPKTDLLTELSRDLEEGYVRRRVRPVRFAACDRRWGYASGFVRAGGAASGLSGGDGRSVSTVSAR